MTTTFDYQFFFYFPSRIIVVAFLDFMISTNKIRDILSSTAKREYITFRMSKKSTNSLQSIL